MKEILVTGATGSVGRHVFSRLSEAGIPVRGLCRQNCDLLRPKSLEPVLDGVESVFLVWPGLAAAQAEPVIELIAKHARRLVYLSVQRDVERVIEHSGVPWTFLRPGSLAVSTLAWADQVRSGVVRSPYERVALIHEKDVADVATHVLVSAGHQGVRYPLSGPEALTPAEQVRVIGEVIGREVRWEDDGGAGSPVPETVTSTVQVLTGRRPLTFREWVHDHAGDFR